ncbi:MAG: hypothetical protein KDK78_06105 [Chlamydiia bacterium]|nr:hypothetical protein [Chlamydiia bacterium]
MMNAVLNTNAAQALSQHLFAMPNSIPNVARSLSTLGATALAAEAAICGYFALNMFAEAGAPTEQGKKKDPMLGLLLSGVGLLGVGGAIAASAGSWLGYRWVCQSALSSDPGVQHLWSFVLLPYAAVSLHALIPVARATNRILH